MTRLAWAALTPLTLVACAADGEVESMTTHIDVLARERAFEARGLVREDELWLDDATCAEVFGDVPEDVPVRGSLVNASAAAERLGHRWVASVDGGVWSLAASPAVARAELLAGRAPDLTLADRDGNDVRLSDFRGKKVLLLTWASW